MPRLDIATSACFFTSPGRAASRAGGQRAYGIGCGPPTGARHGAYPGHPCCCVDARRYGLAAHARNLQHVRMRTHGNDGAPMLAVCMRNSTEKYGCPSYTGNYVLGGWRVEREKSYQQKREVGIDAADK